MTGTALGRLSLQPIKVCSTVTGQDDSGVLLLFDGRLAAVFVKLGSMHGPDEGCWHLEVGFGLCTGRSATFPNLKAASRWVGERCLPNGDEIETEIVELIHAR